MSEKEQSFTESDTLNSRKTELRVEGTEERPSISTQLHLRSPKSLDKDVVLWRIRQRKCMNKVKNTFHSLMSLNHNGLTANGVAQEQGWIDLGDAFTCP